MLVIRSDQQNPHYNLALEESLLNRVDEHDYILLFYQNENAVVIGKNQNPWRECRLPLMREEGCALARRITGGGAVYHDLGNLNFSFMMRRTAYKEQRQYEIILAALDTLGVAAHIEGRTSLYYKDRKFSGHAFCFRKNAALHHGTLLLRSDLDKLQRYLGEAVSNIDTKAVASIPAKVMNLSEIVPSIDATSMMDLIVEAASKAFDRTPLLQDVDSLGLDVVGKARQQASWEWLYGRTPAFVWRGEMVGSAGPNKIVITVKHGLSVEVEGADEQICAQLAGQRWTNETAW